MRRVRSRPKRRRFFVCCEGESERSYVRLLSGLADAQRLHVHLDAVIPGGGGGDVSSLIAYAVREARARESRLGAYRGKVLFLDDDGLLDSRRKSELQRQAEAGADISLIWQSPCHEAFLLRHLAGCGRLRPATNADALKELRKRWPDYEKGLSASGLRSNLDADAVRRAAGVECALARFLADLGFK